MSKFDFRLLNDSAEHVALGPDGTIVLGGYANGASRNGYCVARARP